MKAFITGISGFVGANLARHLLKRGFEVHGLTRKESRLWRLQDIKSQIKLHDGDLTNPASIKLAIKKARPDYIFHLGVYGAYPSQTDPYKIFKTAIIGTQALIEGAKEGGVKMIINCGSSSEYGTKNHPMREDEPVEPNSYYAIAKSAQTNLCTYFSKKENLPIITFRLFSVYGQYEEPGRLVPTVMTKALVNKEITVSDPTVGRDFIYIDDVCNLLTLATRRPELSGEVFNCGTGIQSTLGDIPKNIINLVKSKSPITIGNYKGRSFDTKIWVADMKKTKVAFPKIKITSLEDGLKKSIPWFKKNIQIYEK